MGAVWGSIKAVFGCHSDKPKHNFDRFATYPDISHTGGFTRNTWQSDFTNNRKYEVSEIKSISIFPSVNDLFGEKPELKGNIVKGAYENVDHYLTVQFKLLREDFIAPLREAIAEYLDSATNCHSETTSDIIVFQNVKIIRATIESYKFGHLIQVDKRNNWAAVSDFLIFGSLLLFTTNDFKSFFSATVIKAETQNRIIVKLHRSQNTVCQDIYSEEFTVVVSKVFFEPYFHVLTALQNMTSSDFPMVKYIVEVDPKTNHPAYTRRPGQSVYIIRGESVDILNQHWPQFTSVKFNPSQLRALKAALANEFVVIQGPPGTGKTFLAHQIMTALLENMPECKPILVVCFKNHALDQFLEGLIKKTENIIRIGGRGNNKNLKEFNLKNHGEIYGFQKFKKRIVSLAKEYYKQEEKLNYCLTNGDAVLVQDITSKMLYLEDAIRNVEEQMRNAMDQANLSVLKRADVIGMTTTGAARLRPMLNQLGAKIVVIEEAAEVLESHIVTALSRDCQHVILIGDHKQLRPNPAVYQLCTKYNLDISLFERMVNNGMSCYTLDVQHRMRPEFTSLIAPAIYPTLTDHQTTKGRPNILGVKHNLYFITHNRLEEQLRDSVSYVNQFEADFVVELARYLILQGYSTDQITILTTYSDQVKRITKLKKKYSRNLTDLRVTTVDDFEGEENKIIILSLVRSNKGRNIGFLKAENRVCVALSRARDGFYIIGNMGLLSRNSEIWPKVKASLRQHQALGNSLSVYCQNHPESVTQARNGAILRALPEGGCRRKCMAKLRCGHVCQYHCHPCDQNHKAQYSCPHQCGRYANGTTLAQGSVGNPASHVSSSQSTRCLVDMK